MRWPQAGDCISFSTPLRFSLSRALSLFPSRCPAEVLLGPVLFWRRDVQRRLVSAGSDLFAAEASKPSSSTDSAQVAPPALNRLHAIPSLYRANNC